ncbi:MAG: hypothetical protein JXQ90_03635 [Cyclobacteriaceae bacterium]
MLSNWNHAVIDVNIHAFVIYPGLDHWNTNYKTPKDSFVGNPGIGDPKVSELIIQWAQGIVLDPH